MVSWEAIVLQNHLVVHVFIVEHNLAVHDVFKLSLPLRHFHSNDVRLAISLLLLNLLLAQSFEAEAIVFSLCVLLAANLDSHLFQALSRAEARVCVTIFYQSVRELVIQGETLALVVGAVRTLRFEAAKGALIGDLCEAAGALIPRHARPLQHFYDIINRALNFSVLYTTKSATMSDDTNHDLMNE